ncbi:MAG: GNAT family N-acetyltransferase [Niastella sp.]|jgi:hypothetical protein|uniref:GNAT family N-acetyltransferase n=1 Tax=Niastella sp. TaxID=1869183 RepID=UPI00389A8D22
MNSTMPLYISLAPDNKYDPVFEQTFLPGKVNLALRPLSLPHDWPYVSKWLQHTIGRRVTTITHLPHKYLRETYAIMLQCDFAQPFVGLINQQPAFLVEICDGDKQCDGVEAGTHLFKPGDHVMRLILSHTAIHTRFWSEHALFSSLAYFFSHQQVKRIVWQLHEKDKFYINLANQSGITVSKPPKADLDSAQDAQDRRGGIQVYLYLRENFQRFLTLYHRTMQKLP